MAAIPDERTLSVVPQGIPAELRELAAWAVWRHETDDRGHESKPPFRADGSGERARASAPETWSSFGEALNQYYGRHGFYEGVSFAIHELHGIVGVDLDHIAEHKDDAWEIARMLGSYTEWSPSGEGLRIFVRGTLPDNGRRRRDWVEMYSGRRFLTVTGRRLLEFPPLVRDNQTAIDYVHGLYLGMK
jgi:primase-polymerase (primpol)-like protein